MLDHTVVSIQGLVSVYSRHYLDGVPAKLVYHKTVKEFIKNNNLYHASKVMEKQGKEEIFTLKKQNTVSVEQIGTMLAQSK